MTTFGVDFHQHLAATKRKDIPYIMEKCMETIDENGLSVKVCDCLLPKNNTDIFRHLSIAPH